jgi:toxin FitB
MYLIDTNVVSELRNLSKAHPNVRAWNSGIDVTTTFLSVVTVMEIELGAVLKQRKDTTQARVFRSWLHGKVLPEFDGRILPVSTAVALRWASLQVPKTRSYRDALIAATALEHKLTVVTRNVADFESTGVPIINPWINKSS